MTLNTLSVFITVFPKMQVPPIFIELPLDDQVNLHTPRYISLFFRKIASVIGVGKRKWHVEYRVIALQLIIMHYLIKMFCSFGNIRTSKQSSLCTLNAVYCRLSSKLSDSRERIQRIQRLALAACKLYIARYCRASLSESFARTLKCLKLIYIFSNCYCQLTGTRAQSIF